MEIRPDAARADFESWMVARQGRLLRTAYLLTGDVHAAEDLVQTALAKLYLAWDRVSGAESVDAYARKILVNEHTTTWRRLWRHREVVTDTERARRPGECRRGVRRRRATLCGTPSGRCPSGSAPSWCCATTNSSPNARPRTLWASLSAR